VTPPETEDALLLDQLRIRRVIERYCALLDRGALEELLQLFDENCSVFMMGKTYRGRNELASTWSRLVPTDRPLTLHAVANSVIAVSGPTASATSGWAMFDRSGPDAATVISLAGWYHDELGRGPDGQWRFTARRVVTIARPAAR
jgi:hypothetical protein